MSQRLLSREVQQDPERMAGTPTRVYHLVADGAVRSLCGLLPRHGWQGTLGLTTLCRRCAQVRDA